MKIHTKEKTDRRRSPGIFSLCLCVLLCGLFLVTGTGCRNDGRPVQTAETGTETPGAKPAAPSAIPVLTAAPRVHSAPPTPSPTPTAPPVTLTVTAIGDMLYHMPIVNTGRDNWNYDFLFDHVRQDIQAADIAIANQESPYISDHSRLSGYPSFASPVEAGDAAVNAGFDVILYANNHANDIGDRGIERKGVKVAVLNATYGLNNPLGADEQYKIDLFDQTRVAQQVQAAREQSDFVIFCLHGGTEYSEKPDRTMTEWCDFLTSLKVDLIIGCHPHVLQSFEMKTGPDGHQTLVYYSLGNFFSNQNGMNNLLGGMALVTLTKQDGMAPVITGYTLIPTVTHYNRNTPEYTVYKLEDYTNDLAAQHSIRRRIGDSFTVEGLWALFDKQMQP